MGPIRLPAFPHPLTPPTHQVHILGAGLSFSDPPHCLLQGGEGPTPASGEVVMWGAGWEDKVGPQ